MNELIVMITKVIKILFMVVLFMLISVNIYLCNGETQDVKAIINQLMKIVEDPSQSIDSRVEAAQLLGRLGEQAKEVIPSMVAVLRRLKGRELEPLQIAIIDSLGQMGYSARMALPTFALASGRSSDIDRAIMRATKNILSTTDEHDIAALTMQLGSKDPSQRLRAVDALRRMGGGAKEATPAIMALLDDGDYTVRNAAIETLIILHGEGNIPEAVIRAVAKDLNESDPGRRLHALYRLSKFGATSAIVADEIDKLRNDPDMSVRRLAQDALNKILGKGR
jgi:HEAT repeat protein